MVKKTKKDNKNLIIGICAAVVVLVIVIVAVVLATSGNQLNDDYFKSDDTKYVLTYETSDLNIDENDEETAYMPIKTHMVYTYKDDEITGLKTYGEYADSAAAQKALDAMKEMGDSDVQDAVVEGKYIVITASPDQYEGMTASDVKQQIEVIEMLKQMNTDGGGDFESSTDEEVVEETE